MYFGDPEIPRRMAIASSLCCTILHSPAMARREHTPAVPENVCCLKMKKDPCGLQSPLGTRREELASASNKA